MSDQDEVAGLRVRPAAPDPAGDEPAEDTAADEPEERGWDRFGPVEQSPPGLVRRVLGGIGRFFAHEWTLASLAGLALAVIMTWPTLRHPATTIPQDLGDPMLQAWQLAWSGHAVLTDPLHLWNSNSFYPDTNSLAFSDSLLGYAPLSLIGSGPVAALVRYNVLYVLVHALAFVGMYALARQLGARRPGAAVAAAAFGYAPWTLAHGGHLNILSIGAIPLALAMLARGHGFTFRRTERTESGGRQVIGGYRPEGVRIGWVIGGWAVAAWQMTLGFGLGLPFAYVLGGVVLALLVGWPVTTLVFKRHVPKRLPVADLGGLIIFAAASVYMGIPYLRVVQAHPNAKRSLADVALFSPPWKGFLVAPAESWLWGGRQATARDALSWPPEMTLLVGFAVLGFAALGLFVSVWSVRARLLMALGTAVSVVLGMGTQFPGGGEYTYAVLYHYLPAWDAIRTPGRLILWTTLLVGLLAAGMVSKLALSADEVALSRGRNPQRRLGPFLRVLVAIPMLLVLVEGVNQTPHPVVPTEPTALSNVAGPVLILPTDQLTDEKYMYWSTDGFPVMVNGGSGFQPTLQDQIRQVAISFPDQRSVSYLRQLGIRTVVVLRDGLAGTQYQNVIAKSYAAESLGIKVRDTGDAVIFTL